MKRILALDLSSSTGWAYANDVSDRADGGGIVLYGEWKFTGHAAEKFRQFNNKLGELPYKLDLVVYERPHFRGYPATFLLVGLATRVEEWAYRKGFKCEAVHSATLKKHITGFGKAEKADVIAAVKKRFKIKGELGNDEADALSALAYSIDKLGG